jgi:SAM-dependent methyltransferase
MNSVTAKSVLESTIKYYNANARAYSEQTLHVDLSHLYERFGRLLPPGAHILDAGCGSGRDTKAFLERGYRVTPIDASRELVRFASAYTRHPCQVLRFQDMAFQGVFDGLWACASLLHVPNEEIQDVLALMIKALKPGATLYISLKEGEGERIAEDGRFFADYTRESFERLLALFPSLSEIDFWKSAELTNGCAHQPWLSFLLKKMGP